MRFLTTLRKPAQSRAQYNYSTAVTHINLVHYLGKNAPGLINCAACPVINSNSKNSNVQCYGTYLAISYIICFVNMQVRFVKDVKERKRILQACHSDTTSGHLG